MKIMILKEHHGTVYLDASTEERLYRAALSVIVGRFDGEDKHYFLGEPLKPEPPFVAEEISSLPLSLQQEASKQMEEYHRQRLFYEEDMRGLDAIKRCIKQKDGKLALAILKKRSHYEDEGMELVEVHETYPDSRLESNHPYTEE